VILNSLTAPAKFSIVQLVQALLAADNSLMATFQYTSGCSPGLHTGCEVGEAVLLQAV
jgi:hypothetical protein